VKPRHGLVRGAFNPPHAGHHLLVRTAARACERVTVQVVASRGERIPAELRAAWLREVHAPERNVDVVVGGSGGADAVFTEDAIGRGLLPVSSAAIRRDPIASWEYLAPPVRAYLAKRLVIVGSESTGKTTLARELRDALAARGGAFAETRWVPELGRDYTLEKLALARAEAGLRGAAAPGMADLVWTTDDFAAIARGQNALETAEASRGGPVLVCDTDTFATAVWHERYLGARAPEVESLAISRPSLYLVTHPDDVPFVGDEIRDGEHLRGWMTERFVERLRASPHRFEILRGTRGERVARAGAALDRWLAGALAEDFAPA